MTLNIEQRVELTVLLCRLIADVLTLFNPRRFLPTVFETLP